MWIERLNQRSLRAICIAICLGYFIAGFWPFNFFPRNNVTWPPDGKGVSLGRNSIIYSERALDLRQSAGAVTIELYLQPGIEPARNLASIMSLYDGELPENLVISQRGSELLLQVPVCGVRGERKSQQVAVNAGLRSGIRRFIAITSGAGGTAIYLDGVLARAYPNLTLGRDTLQGRLVLGDAPDGHRSWDGRLLGVALFSRVLDPAEIARHHGFWTGSGLQTLACEPRLSALYFFNEGSGRTIKDHSPSGSPLLIPEFYQVLRRTVLSPPWKGSSVRDITQNILGFVPFGFFFFTYRVQRLPGRAMRNAFLTVMVSGMISLAIELLQACVPTRSSSTADLICNTGGSLLGVLIAAALSLIQSRAPRRMSVRPRSHS